MLTGLILIVHNVQYMQSRRLRTPILSTRCESDAGYNR